MGTFLFQLLGGAAAVTTGAALGNGLALMIAVYATASISGGHLNPAVSMSQVFSGSKMSWKKWSGYASAQVFGAVVAACILKFMLGGHPEFTTVGSLGSSMSGVKRIFIWEMFGTFALCYVVL